MGLSSAGVCSAAFALGLGFLAPCRLGCWGLSLSAEGAEELDLLALLLDLGCLLGGTDLAEADPDEGTLGSSLWHHEHLAWLPGLVEI